MASDVLSGVVTGGLALVSGVAVAVLSRGNVRMRWRRAFIEWADLLNKLPEGSDAREDLSRFLDEGTEEILRQSRIALHDDPALAWFHNRPLLAMWCVTVVITTSGFLYAVTLPELHLWMAPIAGVGLASASALLTWLLAGMSSSVIRKRK